MRSLRETRDAYKDVPRINPELDAEAEMARMFGDIVKRMIERGDIKKEE